MVRNTKIVFLSPEEAAYITRLTSEDNSFAALLRSHPDLQLDGRTVTLNRALAETLRDHFTERLAKVGFDANYLPNKEGQMLEKLIDTFFMPETAQP